jgi:hypothetical protein
MKKSAGKLKREHSMGLWLTTPEKFIIDNKSRNTGLSTSSYVRKMAIEGNVNARFTDEELEMVKQLIGMSNELHQVVMLSREGNLLTAMLHFELYRDKFDQVFNKLVYDK